MCGKDQSLEVIVSIWVGSPPHVRERLCLHSLSVLYSGITPACAGKTKSISDHVSARKDHPRMCGKDIEKEKINGIDLGSPPHVRERLIKSLNLPEATGITPACAGKTTEGDGYLYQNRDHPRM